MNENIKGSNTQKKLNVISGRKRDFKPDKQVIANALARKLSNPEFLHSESFEEYAEKHRDDFLKILYLKIRLCNALDHFGNSHTAEAIETDFDFVSIILAMLRFVTPKEFICMFPPEKRYDGAKYQSKDYFTTMEAIKKLDMEQSINDEIVLLNLLWDYRNREINRFMVSWMSAVSHMRQAKGGMDPLEEFMQKEGVPTYTYHKNEGYLYNQMTGETVKVEKSNRRKPKYLKIVEGKGRKKG